MDKTVRVVRPGDNKHDYDWALAYTGEERLNIAGKLLEDAWEFAHKQEFPRLDRKIVRIIRQP